MYLYYNILLIHNSKIAINTFYEIRKSRKLHFRYSKLHFRYLRDAFVANYTNRDRNNFKTVLFFILVNAPKGRGRRLVWKDYW